MKKNILLLVNQLHTGGAQKVIANLSTHFSENYNVFLVIYNDHEHLGFSYKGQLIRIKLPFDKNTHVNSFPKRLIRFFALLREVKKIKKEQKIDVAISFLEASNIINVLSRKKEKIILSVRSFLSHEFNDHPRLKIFKIFIRRLYNKAEGIVVPAKLIKKDLVDNFGLKEKKILVIYNFVDQELVEHYRKDLLPPHFEYVFEKFPVIVNVGRITGAKAQKLLVPVIKELKKKHPTVKLVILGDGTLKQDLIDHAEYEGLNVFVEGATSPSRITENFDIYLAGFIKNPFPFLQRSTLFIKSSIYEGFPNVIIEAMSCGLPVISSDCESGPREILDPESAISQKAVTAEFDEYGILVPVGEGYREAALSALHFMFSDKDSMAHYKAQSLKRAGHFGRDKIIAQWIQLIEQN